MSRIHTPASVEAFPQGSRTQLSAVAKSLGSVPNLFRLVGNSPAALKGYLGLGNALSGARLDAKTQERIALAVAEINGCGYCLSAHTYLGRNVAKRRRRRNHRQPQWGIQRSQGLRSGALRGADRQRSGSCDR